MSHQGISREHPLLSATLPDGARIQIIAPPATRGPLALAIRKHVSPELELSDYVASGRLRGDQGEEGVRALGGRPGARRPCSPPATFAECSPPRSKARKNILVSGGTSTGKTTFLNALLKEVPAEERLILIEDTPELFVRHENHVGLIAARSALGEAQVETDDLVAASLRMRPDRIILGELRGGKPIPSSAPSIPATRDR